MTLVFNRFSGDSAAILRTTLRFQIVRFHCDLKSLRLQYFRNCLQHVQSNSVPSRLLPNSCLLTPVAAQNRTEFRGSFLALSKGKATKFVQTREFSKLTRFRNTEIYPLCWTWTWLKHFPDFAIWASKVENTSWLSAPNRAIRLRLRFVIRIANRKSLAI